VNPWGSNHELVSSILEKVKTPVILCKTPNGLSKIFKPGPVRGKLAPDGKGRAGE